MKAETQRERETTDRLNFRSIMFSRFEESTTSIDLMIPYLELSEQQRILEYSLDRFDEVRLESRRVLLLGVA